MSHPDITDLQSAVTAHWSARAPLFDGVASHVAKRDLWREVLKAAFQAEIPSDVVDLGCGTGACAIIAAELGHRVRAFDASPEMIASARWAARVQSLDVVFENALIHEVPLADASADIVTLRNVLWTLEEPKQALRVTHRLLRPGGLIVVSDGMWSVAPQYRSTYAPEIAARLPLHDGLTQAQAERMLNEAEFTNAQSWQHLFPTSPYPGDVPVFVLSATRP
ncbi:class I SAM-dependent methyltransferase [Ancylobacter mangrovi]|uniref:class I SAM-dependent methyltransferase n=1 Tax=Ancylobacter mangrovi TaxID=2972472 RepID=UPI002162EC47|nr:class I SAM-dependent methyltransferase [Ancylobacter mangrovi]MCS0504767.1 class I SAM-dependent methyltransferase [Ancylobacter mangrovi]